LDRDLLLWFDLVFIDFDVRRRWVAEEKFLDFILLMLVAFSRAGGFNDWARCRVGYTPEAFYCCLAGVTNSGSSIRCDQILDSHACVEVCGILIMRIDHHFFPKSMLDRKRLHFFDEVII
jgi:hypothetical protein